MVWNSARAWIGYESVLSFSKTIAGTTQQAEFDSHKPNWTWSGLRKSQMLQLAQTTGQAVADQSQGISLSQLTKQHRNKLRPACKSSRMSFGFGCFHQSAKFGAGEVMKKLIKQTSGQYHILALLFAAWLASALQRIRCGSAHYRRAFSFSGLS